MRLFAGVWPPPEALAALTQLERPELPGVRWVAPAQWHVTVRFFGEVDAADVDGLIERLRAVARRTRQNPPIEAALGPRVGRLGPRILAVDVDGLAGLAEAIRAATIPLGGRGPSTPPGRGPSSAGGHTGGDPLGASAGGARLEGAAAGGPGGALAGAARVSSGGKAGDRAGDDRAGDDRAGDPDVPRPFVGHLTLARCRRGAAVGDVVGQAVNATWVVEDLALIASELGPGGSRYRDIVRLPLVAQRPGS